MGRAIVALLLVCSTIALAMDDEVIIHPLVSWAIKLLVGVALIAGYSILGNQFDATHGAHTLFDSPHRTGGLNTTQR